MSHPIPSHDKDNEYPSDNYKPVEKKHQHKKADMARKMKSSLVERLKDMIDDSKSMRKNFPKWLKEGQGGHGSLPPGHKDRDNE